MNTNSNPFLRLTAPGIASLSPYIPGKPTSELERELGICGSVKLASNENPLGCSEKVITALQKQLNTMARYPDGGGFALRNALAKKHAVDLTAITLGNGSNDILDMVARVFLAPGYESLFSQHAFAIYSISSQAVGATLKMAPAIDYGHDLEAMAALVTDKTRVIWIANPNNPTGTWLKAAELKAFIAKLPETTVVVIDEAYIEYVDESDYPDCSNWLSEFKNLIVTRTFSKAYGLASLRIGYSISDPAIADLLNRVRQPFNVNSMALAAAEAALQDQAFIGRVVMTNRLGMRQLCDGFKAMGLSWIPSVGNFVCIDVAQEAETINQALLKEGCITRPIAAYGMPNHLRISVGLEEENQRLLTALKKVLKR
jgi:histidinol-phosphate aminotransferase